jgi:hypothetical protein
VRHALKERKPYQQRVIADVGRSVSLFQHIGVPGETFSL